MDDCFISQVNTGEPGICSDNNYVVSIKLKCIRVIQYFPMNSLILYLESSFFNLCLATTTYLKLILRTEICILLHFQLTCALCTVICIVINNDPSRAALTPTGHSCFCFLLILIFSLFCVLSYYYYCGAFANYITGSCSNNPHCYYYVNQ